MKEVDWNKIKYVASGRDCTYADSGRYLAIGALFATILKHKMILPFLKESQETKIE